MESDRLIIEAKALEDKSYPVRHTDCYKTLLTLKRNWYREVDWLPNPHCLAENDGNVFPSPYFDACEGTQRCQRLSCEPVVRSITKPLL